MKTSIILSFFVMLFLHSTNSLADVQTSFVACKNIEPDLERLNCFDDIVKRHPSESSGSQFIELETVKNIRPPASITRELISNKEQEGSLQKSTQATSDFGLEINKQDEIVESYIVGEFKGWKKGMKLKLRNGQIWKVTNVRPGYGKKQNPAITISRGIFGSFDAKIKGLKTKAKVKRIK